MAPTHQEIFERYVHAGAITRNPDAIAAMFTEDGVLDAVLLRSGGGGPRSQLRRYRMWVVSGE